MERRRKRKKNGEWRETKRNGERQRETKKNGYKRNTNMALSFFSLYLFLSPIIMSIFHFFLHKAELYQEK